MIYPERLYLQFPSVCFRFYIYVDQTQEGEKDFSVAEDLDGSQPKVGYTAIDFPTVKNFNGKLKKLRYYPSAVYKDLAGRGECPIIEKL